MSGGEDRDFQSLPSMDNDDNDISLKEGDNQSNSVTQQPDARILAQLDTERLEAEMEEYHRWLDERCDGEYRLATVARSRGLDHSLEVEIPRASDLAGRCEKLLHEYLDGMEIAQDIRDMLLVENREVTSIKMAELVATRCIEEDRGLAIAVDTGLRVGLAILTEAVLVAPLQGISDVSLLSNLDGSEFVSVSFAGPIRAAGGTAQALAVLIADVIRQKLGIAKYEATRQEIERVKEEFGLYRKGLQFRPTPDQVESIVSSLPVMVNGEGTEDIEVSGYRDLPNVEDNRVRGGVLLVVGEGLCLKAPKLQKHTGALDVKGWDFISEFANKGKNEGETRKSRLVKPDEKFMADIIAGRPVFSEPSRPGGFRLRYGRTRLTGLAAGAMHPVSMEVMNEFIATGTQLKIERPGKATAVTPCDELDGPTLLLKDGRYLQTNDVNVWRENSQNLLSVWDNGEIALGYGEFLENNKPLVPSAYNRDWWASDLLESICTEDDVTTFLELINVDRKDAPAGIPCKRGTISELSITEKVRREWHEWLRTLELPWGASSAISNKFGTALVYPNNPWWSDLPLDWVSPLIDALTSRARTEPKPNGEGENLRLFGCAEGWAPLTVGEVNEDGLPGLKVEPLPSNTPIDPVADEGWRQNGLIKAAVMTLGAPHHHDGNDILITRGWEAILDGLGFEVPIIGDNVGQSLKRRVDVLPHLERRREDVEKSYETKYREDARLEALEASRREARRVAETRSRQFGGEKEEIELAGQKAADSVVNPGPDDPELFEESISLIEDDQVDKSLWLVRKTSDYRWEDSATTRIGARMGRPEKAAPREMSPTVNALFPIGHEGGMQRLLGQAIAKVDVRVQLGVRLCLKCDKHSPFIRCHHPSEDNTEDMCNGRTEPHDRVEYQSMDMLKLAENTLQQLGISRFPERVKCVQGLISKTKTPESLAKGILRAKHGLPVFRDGTCRFDMGDVPVTHFTPKEIGVEWQRLADLGYTTDHHGHPLENDEQLLELFPQDFIASTNAQDFLTRNAQYVDELLERFYDLPPFYNAISHNDMVGQLIVALAPHTSGGVLGRLIGWTPNAGGYAHPLFHAAKRRNADGDEDAIMLLLDGLLNFSLSILPAGRGGQMDAPLVLTTRINPTEVDKEALNVDSGWYYPQRFYEATQDQPHPKSVSDYMDYLDRRLPEVAARRGLGFGLKTTSLDLGPPVSAYKTLVTMTDKMESQLSLAGILRAVDAKRVATAVIEGHFLKDLRGNLVAFTRQKVRCGRCGHSYRRVPLAGRCIQTKKIGRSISGFGSKTGNREAEYNSCGGNLILTVSEGAVRKYIKVTGEVLKFYGVRDYTKQRFHHLVESADSLFKNDRVKVFTLDDFL